MERRKFLKSALYSFAGAATLGGLYAWQVEPFWVEFTKHRMPLKMLPKELVGKTLMQISDIHIGNRFDHNQIIQGLEKAKAFKPDFVAYTGDYVTIHNGEVQYDKLTKVFRHFVRGSIATYGILGNHDYGKHWKQPEVADRITGMLEKAGVKVLRNRRQSAAGLNFFGLDDYWGQNFHPEQALEGIEVNSPNIALCHNPDVCDLDIWHGFEGWILSGHTHGGQVRPPFLPPPVLPVTNKRYTCGQFDLSDNRTLYINRALGNTVQVRFNVRPEITIFELCNV